MQIRNTLTAVGCAGLLMGADAAKNKNKPLKIGSGSSSSSSSSSDTQGSSMSAEPVNAYFTDPNLEGSNVPTTGFSSIDSFIKDKLNSYSEKNKLYSITVESYKLDIKDVREAMLTHCGAKPVSGIVTAGLDKIAEDQDLQSVLRDVAIRSRGNHQIRVQTIDAPGNSTFETCLGNQAFAQLNRLASGSAAKTAPLLAAAALALGAALTNL